MTFDIHLATEKLADNIGKQLASIGFTRAEFIGGTEGVWHKYHFSIHPNSRQEFDAAWSETTQLLTGASAGDFYGYAEAETVGGDYCTAITWKPFDSLVPPPFEKVIHVECESGRSKSFDFHVSTDLASLDSGLERVLEKELGLYHVDIKKANGAISRVYTFQPMDVAESARPYYSALRAYLLKAGGMNGKLKMEATSAFARFPESAPVPPVTTQMPKLLNNLNMNEL